MYVKMMLVKRWQCQLWGRWCWGWQKLSIENENDEPDPCPSKKKKATNVDKDGQDHDGFKKPQQQKTKSSSQGHQGKLKKPNVNLSKKFKPKKTLVVNRVSNAKTTCQAAFKVQNEQWKHPRISEWVNVLSLSNIKYAGGIPNFVYVLQVNCMCHFFCCFSLNNHSTHTFVASCSN